MCALALLAYPFLIAHRLLGGKRRGELLLPDAGMILLEGFM